VRGGVVNTWYVRQREIYFVAVYWWACDSESSGESNF